MLKFLQEKDAIKWANSIYYAKLLAECKHRDKLFLPDSRSVRSKEANKSTSSKSKVLIVVPNSPVEVK